MTQPSCADCLRPATMSLGSTWLCAWCKWEFQADVLARRPDLRAPGIGTGRPTGTGNDPLGPPRLRCDVCETEWHGKPLEPCPWCERREVWQREIQASIEKSRFEEALKWVAEGEPNHFGIAISLAKRVPDGEALLAKALAKRTAA